MRNLMLVLIAIASLTVVLSQTVTVEQVMRQVDSFNSQITYLQSQASNLQQRIDSLSLRLTEIDRKRVQLSTAQKNLQEATSSDFTQKMQIRDQKWNLLQADVNSYNIDLSNYSNQRRSILSSIPNLQVRRNWLLTRRTQIPKVQRT